MLIQLTIELRNGLTIRYGGVNQVPPTILKRHHIKEKIKHRNDKINAFVNKVSEDINAYQKYQNIGLRYKKLISTQF